MAKKIGIELHDTNRFSKYFPILIFYIMYYSPFFSSINLKIIYYKWLLEKDNLITCINYDICIVSNVIH